MYIIYNQVSILFYDECILSFKEAFTCNHKKKKLNKKIHFLNKNTPNSTETK